MNWICVEQPVKSSLSANLKVLLTYQAAQVMKELMPQTSVAEPGSGAFLTPGSETHIVESLVTIFWAKSTIILSELIQIFSLIK
jgi:hypothetical protein